MSISLSRLFDFHFIFNPILPAIKSGIADALYIVFNLSIVFAIISSLLSKKSGKNKNLPQKKMWQKITNFLFTFGIVGLLLILIRQSRAYFISMPFLFYLFIITMIVWLVFIIKWNFTKKKKMIREIKEKMEKEKYL